MTWNWQKPDWPHFSWDPHLMRVAEEEFLRGSGLISGTLRHLPGVEIQQLAIEEMSSEALTTSAIEGEILDRESVQSSLRMQLGLASDQQRTRPAEQGIADMMIELCRDFNKPLTKQMLFTWHRQLMKGRENLNDVGRYRTAKEAMQVVSGPLHAPKLHFEAPPHTGVSGEMSRFLRWFNRTAPTGTKPLPALTRAGIAHLYFESIHPFEDGNGRIGRAISEKALSQAAGHSTLTALSETVLLRQKSYYSALEVANKSNHITGWLIWFAALAIEAQRRTASRIEFLLDKTRLLDRLRGQLNQRQEKALLRMLREGPEGFKGGLSAGNYMTITGASPATTTRDLAALVDNNALSRNGERRHARYHLTIPLRRVPPVSIDRHGNLSSS